MVKLIICEPSCRLLRLSCSDRLFVSLTVGFGIATVICLYNDEVNFEYKGLMIAPNVTVASIMACRLYRELKLGIIPW